MEDVDIDIPHEHEDDGRSLKSDKDKDDGRKSERKRASESARENNNGSAHKLEITATSGDKSIDAKLTDYKTWYYSAKCLGVLEELDAKK
jgi:hypothetical protein